MARHTLKFIRIAIIFCTLVLTLLPFYILIKSSFEPYYDIVSSNFHLLPKSWTYFDNYIFIFTQYPMVRWIINSLFICFCVIAGNLVFDTLAAYALSRLTFRGKNAAFLFILFSVVIPEQVILVPLYLLMTQLGWVNTYWALIVPSMISAFGIFLMRQSFLGIPKDLDEAAIIDGCNRMQVLTRIIIPNAKSSFLTLAVIKFMWTWGKYMWPSIVINSKEMRPLAVGVASFQVSAATIPWDAIITGSVVTIVPIVLAFLALQKYFVQGLTDGAVKG